MLCECLAEFPSYTPNHPVVMDILHEESGILKAWKYVVFAGFLAIQAYPAEEAINTAAKEVAFH
jgi:hypothetical protein